MIKQAGRITNVTHLNVVLFSEDVAKEEHLFAELMDIFLREKEMLRSVKVAIAKGQAGDFLNILSENEKIPGQYISKLLENKSNLEIATPITTMNATDKDIVWKSSDEKIATVSKTGIITALSVGTTTITASTKDGKFSANCKLTVAQKTSSEDDH